MKKRYCIVATLVFISLISLNHAQNKSSLFIPSKSFQKPKGFLDSLLDPSKFSMKQSYTFSLFSMGGKTLNQGLYLNTMTYRFSNPLLVQLRVGLLHQPFGGFGSSTGLNSKLFLQRAMVQYRPSNSMVFTIDYQMIPTHWPYNYYYRK